ncbi:MAG: ABC transporter ATP-binding protein [Clostridiales bacterium]|nr:ABC transporter ATP-binding protein [Clostridiales bacterium]
MSNLLEVKGLCKSYGGFSLKDVSFGIPGGYIMGFIGPNGAGKTTTIKSILGMINRDAGDIRLLGAGDARGLRPNKDIGVVMDAPMYADDWTCADVEAAVSPFYRGWDFGKYAELLDKFELDRKKKVKDLSRGMKVKLMIAAALSHDAKLLILDEPTSGLDPVARDELCELLTGFVTDENHSILFSTHITADLEKIADYITFIQGGQIIYTGTKESLLEKYAMVKGGPSELNAEQKRLVIGMKEHSTGFSGIAETGDLGKLPKSLLIEPVSLDEIIIYMNKGVRLDD